MVHGAFIITIIVVTENDVKCKETVEIQVRRRQHGVCSESALFAYVLLWDDRHNWNNSDVFLYIK